VISALLMLRRLVATIRYAVQEEDFLGILSAALLLIVLGTLAYAVGEDWNLIDALYFAVATLTTTSVSDPDLVLDSAWLKLFAVFYILIGIGVLVETLRRLGVAFVAVQAEEKRPPGDVTAS
jgi:hypothetical protein